MQSIESHLEQMPVVSIIRGVRPDEVEQIGKALFGAGIRIIEVPLNSPTPFESIRILSETLGSSCTIGCGTLVNIEDAERVSQAGGKVAVTPNTNPDIIRRAIELGMIPMPGWATPSEAFAAYQAGARYLKLFPAGSYGSGHVKAVKAVLPDDAKVLAVGGVGAHNAAEWLEAGIDGFGIGSELYKPGFTASEVHNRAIEIVSKINSHRKQPT